MKIILAILIGSAFGFALDQAKATSPQKIINMLRLKDFHLMKVILFGIGFSSLILFLLAAFQLVNISHFSIKPAYTGVLAGGAILGIGFAISGYCPGTSVAALGRGQKDALVFIVGGLLGAFIYMLVYGSIKDSFLFNEIAGGTSSLVHTNPDKYNSLIKDIPAFYIASLVGIVFMALAFLLPSKKE